MNRPTNRRTLLMGAASAPLLAAPASAHTEEPRASSSSDLLNALYLGAGMEPTLCERDQVLMAPVEAFRWDGLYARLLPGVWREGSVDVWRVQVIGSGLLLAKKDHPDFAHARIVMPKGEFALHGFAWQVAGYARITDASVLAATGASA